MYEKAFFISIYFVIVIFIQWTHVDYLLYRSENGITWARLWGWMMQRAHCLTARIPKRNYQRVPRVPQTVPWSFHVRVYRLLCCPSWSISLLSWAMAKFNADNSWQCRPALSISRKCLYIIHGSLWKQYMEDFLPCGASVEINDEKGSGRESMNIKSYFI